MPVTSTALRSRLVAGLGAGFLAVTLVGCTGGDDTETAPSPSASDSAAAAQPDLSGVPEVVAEVNGTAITRDEFAPVYEARFQEASQSGESVDQQQLQTQVLDSMIGTELLLQEGEERGFTASEDEVNASLDEYATQAGLGSRDELLSALAEQGTDEETARAQLRDQVVLDEVLDDEAGDIQPTDEELRELYDQTVAQQEQLNPDAEIPPFEDVVPQLEQQLVQQHGSESAQALVDQLRGEADIETFLE